MENHEKEETTTAPAQDQDTELDDRLDDALDKLEDKLGLETLIDALEKLAADLQAAQKALASMPQGDSPGASAARQQMAQSLSDIAKAAHDMGQPLPDLENAIADLQASQMDTFRRDLDAAGTDLVIKHVEQFWCPSTTRVALAEGLR